MPEEISDEEFARIEAEVHAVGAIAGLGKGGIWAVMLKPALTSGNAVELILLPHDATLEERSVVVRLDELRELVARGPYSPETSPSSTP